MNILMLRFLLFCFSTSSIWLNSSRSDALPLIVMDKLLTWMLCRHLSLPFLPPSPPSLFPSAHFPHSTDFQLKFFAFSGSSPWLGHAHTSLHSCHKQYHRYSLALPSSWDCLQVQVKIVTRFRCFWHNLLIGPKDCATLYIYEGQFINCHKRQSMQACTYPTPFAGCECVCHMPHC